MATTIHLDPRDVPAQLRGSYSGKMFKVVVTDTALIPSDAGLWSEGSRELYTAVRLADGATVPFPGQQSAPWDNGRADRTVTLVPGIGVVRHSIFCGRDMGLTFYLHAADAAPMLPAPAPEMTDHERIVLEATASLKSSYGGKDRYELAAPSSWEAPEKIAAYPTRAQWDAARASLIASGYLNKAGAITTKGRNARGGRI